MSNNSKMLQDRAIL